VQLVAGDVEIGEVVVLFLDLEVAIGELLVLLLHLVEPLSNRLIFLLQALDPLDEFTPKLAPVFRSASGGLLPVFEAKKLLPEAFVFTKNFLRELRSAIE
jgi:hypothetical protein